ncbi:MAG: hypothetical protein NTW78_06020 [Campylobacterales bacterium]|nr:hypothetical protein [Campylobacterales bacterium]
MTNLFSLSSKSGISSVEVEYVVVKDFCEKYELDTIDTFSVIKRIVSEVYSKK